MQAPGTTSIRETRCGEFGMAKHSQCDIKLKLFLQLFLCVASSLMYFTLSSFDIRGQSLIPLALGLSPSIYPTKMPPHMSI
jgi:hypothetical protein